MTGPGAGGRLPGVDAPEQDRTGSPAVAIALGAGVLGLLTSLNTGGLAVSLFFSATALAALPMVLADRPGGRALRFALLGAACAVLGLVLALGPQLFGEQQRSVRETEQTRDDEGRLPEAPAPTATP